MDSVISSLIGSLIEGYFTIIFRNFRKDQFVLSTSTSEASSVLHNLEINRDVVQEILGLSALNVTKMCINTLTVSIQITNILKAPIVLHVDRLDCILSEPWDELKPIPTVLENFLKKLPGAGKPSSYGMAEKILDGITIKLNHLHVEVETRGKYKTEQRGAWTPPPMCLDVKGISIFTTSDRWDVIDLSSAREYNANRKEIFLFKVLQADSLRCTIQSQEGQEIPLIANIPINIRIVIVKKSNNELSALSLEIILDRFQTTLKVEELHYLVSLLKGLSNCFGRRDLPTLPPAPIPHPGRIIGIQVKHLSLVALEGTSGAGVEYFAKNVRVGTFWGPTSREHDKQLEVCVGEAYLREFFKRTGPSAHFILEPDNRRLAKSPLDEIVPIKRTFHHTWPVYEVEKPLLYIRLALGKAPDSPAFDGRILVNPLLITIRPETVSSLNDLVGHATPHIETIQRVHSLRPEGMKDDEEVVVQEGHSLLEEIFLLRANMSHIAIAFPSAKSSEFVQVCLNIANGQLISHPSLPESKLYSKGIASLSEFPGAPGDFVFNRPQVLQQSKTLHNVKFNWQVDIEWTVQFTSPTSPIQRALFMPRISGDFNVSLGRLQEPSSEMPFPKLDPLLLEGGLTIARISGRLTQQQYQAILSRVDQLVLLLPVIRKLSSAGSNVEKPKVPVVFIIQVEKGDWTLCNSVSDNTMPLGEGGFEPSSSDDQLARLEFSGVEICIENSGKQQAIKLLVQQVSLTALPDHVNESRLYNPNKFVHTGSDRPLIAFRFKNIDHPPGRLLEPLLPPSEGPNGEPIKAKANRSYYFGDRSVIDIRVSSLHSGINPNPACNILNFFLKTKINIKNMISSLREAKKSFDDVDLSALAGDVASEFKVDDFVESVKQSLDIDIRLDIQDTRVYLVQDINTTSSADVRGDIALSVKQILFVREVVSELKRTTKFCLDNVNVACNKEERRNAISTRTVFSPVSCSFHTEQEWVASQKEWCLNVGGFFDKIELEVTPSHGRLFMDVVRGIKIKNIQEVINNLSGAVAQVKSQLPAIREQLTDSVLTRAKDYVSGVVSESGSSVEEIDEKELEINSILENVQQMDVWVSKAKKQIDESREENQKLIQSLAAMEQKTGESDIIGNATCKGPLGMLVGKKIVKRFAALSKDGNLFVFTDAKGGKPLKQLKINSNATMAMVEHPQVPNGFQVSSGPESAIFSAPDDMSMMQWTNGILKLQVAQHSEYAAQTADSFHQAIYSLDQVKTYMDRVSSTAKELRDQAKLLARIQALEKQVQEKDSKIASLLH